MDEPPPHHHNNFDRADVVKKNLRTTSKRGYNVRKSRTMSSTTMNKYFFRWGIVI